MNRSSLSRMTLAAFAALQLGGCLIFLPSAARSPRIDDNWWSSYQVVVGFGHGSGIVLSENGYILTAAHVVAADPYIDVRIQTGPKTWAAYHAEVVATDRQYDLAVLKVDGHHFEDHVVLDGDHDARPGDPVYAIGYPYDISETVGRGHILKLHVSFEHAGAGITVRNAILLDLFAGPGASGEGIFAENDGRLVGLLSGHLPMEAPQTPPYIVRYATSVSDIRWFLDKHGIPYYE